MKKLMKMMGFMIYESSAENENDCFPPILFEKQLSLQTSLVVEAEINGSGERYEYSFYKINYDYKTNEIKEIKIYLSGVDETYLLERVFNWLINCRMLSDERIHQLRREIASPKINRQYRGTQKQKIDEQRKRKLGVI